MVDRKKLKLCDKVSHEEDRISKLPDPLISEILSHISTRDAVRTGALSTRWRNLWQWVPALDLSRDSFPNLDAFVSFAERFIDSHKESWIRKLRLRTFFSSHHEKSLLTRVIDAVTTRRIQHLSVRSSRFSVEIPLSIFTCETLVHLQLQAASFPTVEFVSLPCLKIMHLESFRDPNKAMLQKLISGSPVLEDLEIYYGHSTDDRNVLQVCSQTVNKIYIDLSTKVVIDAPLLVHLLLWSVTLADVEFVSLPCLKIMHLYVIKDPSETMLQKLISGSPILEDLRIISYSTDNPKVLQIFSQTVKRIQINLPTKVVIDAPLLQYLRLQVSSTNNFEIISLGISTKLDIVSYDEIFNSSVIHDILTSISRVSDLVISNHFWKDIILYSKSGPVLQFGDLSRLDASISKSNLEILPTILESCPKLESFILTLIGGLSMRHNKKKKKEPKVMFSTVPRCLVSSLKIVELKRAMETGYEGEKELVRYLLKNSTMLQTLKLDIYYPEKAKCGFLQELLTMPRCSSACEIHCSFIAINNV